MLCALTLAIGMHIARPDEVVRAPAWYLERVLDDSVLARPIGKWASNKDLAPTSGARRDFLARAKLYR